MRIYKNSIATANRQSSNQKQKLKIPLVPRRVKNNEIIRIFIEKIKNNKPLKKVIILQRSSKLQKYHLVMFGELNGFVFYSVNKE